MIISHSLFRKILGSHKMKVCLNMIIYADAIAADISNKIASLFEESMHFYVNFK